MKIQIRSIKPRGWKNWMKDWFLETVFSYENKLNYHNTRGCTLLSSQMPNTLFANYFLIQAVQLWKESVNTMKIHQNWTNNNTYYYSFKKGPSFWLVKTPCIIHHNQLLWPNIVSMTSKVQPAADYWTADQENLGTRLSYVWCAEKQREKWGNSFKKGETFWMNNKAIIEFSFRRIWRTRRVLSTSAFGLCR